MVMKRGWIILLGIPILAAAPLRGLPEPTAQELEQNRRDLDNYRKNHPDKFALLHKNAGLFLALTPQRREQLLKLDHELHEQTSAAQARLNNVLERYLEWHKGLDETDRQKIKNAPDKQTRLQILRYLREQDWLKYQPKKIRDELARKPPLGDGLVEGLVRQALAKEKRGQRIRELRTAERLRKQEWQIAVRFWEDLLTEKVDKKFLPSYLTDLPMDIQVFVNDYLRPSLLPADWDRLEKVQGQWPLFPQTLVELADRHPVALPAPRGPRALVELPKDVQTEIKKEINKFSKKGLGKNLHKTLVDAQGRWPHFGEVVTDFAYKRGMIFPFEFWPYNSKGLSEETRSFVEQKLMPVLTKEEKRTLDRHQNRWPDYPQTLDDLARNHHLEVPWQTLPGKRKLWDKYRLKKTAQGFPELPVQTLRDFVQFELTPQERARWKVSHTDPASLERAAPLFFQRHQHVLKRLQKIDQARRPRPGEGHFLKGPPHKPEKPEF